MSKTKIKTVCVFDLGKTEHGSSLLERAMAKIFEIAGWRASSFVAGYSAPADLLVLIGRRPKAEDDREKTRKSLWKYLVAHPRARVCAVLMEPVHKAVQDASLVAILDVTPVQGGADSATGLEALPSVFIWHQFVKTILSGGLFSERHGQLKAWIDRVQKVTNRKADEFLANLAGIAADVEVGCWLSDHGVEGSRLFQRHGIEIFRAWCMSLEEMKRTSSKKVLRVSVLDDQQREMEKRILPEWLWKHSEFRFLRHSSAELKKTIDSCTDIQARAKQDVQQAEIFLVDLDWRHAEDEFFKPVSVALPVAVPTMNAKGMYLLELIRRYNEQFRIEGFQRVAEALDPSAQLKDEERKDILIAWERKYVNQNNEGVVVYHYLKAFDERLPTVVFTAANEHNVKLRQTAGPNTEFVSKSSLMEDPRRLLLALREVYSGRTRTTEAYRRAAVLCKDLIALHTKKLGTLRIDDDNLLKKPGTRVVALLELLIANKQRKFFGRNFELSRPAGSMCAERSAISGAFAAYPSLGNANSKGAMRAAFRRIAVLGDPANTKRKNPCPSCGVCSEWIGKLTEMDTVMFSSCRSHFCYYPRNDRISY